MNKIILSLFFALLAVTSIAQKGKLVTGVIKDSSNHKLQGATIQLIPLGIKKDTLNTLSNNKGAFYFNDVKTNDFKIKISNIGYADFSKIYHYNDGGNEINLPEIQLSSNAKMLEEVIVTVDKTVTIKEDTLEFVADSFKLRADDDVEALLKRIPGVQVDANGNITANGKSVTKIRVNGKDFFSGDLKTATKELPANIVDAVQVIDDYGDQANFTGVKEGDPDKIINIKIKKDKNKGHFGRGQIGYGTDKRYTINGSINRFNNTQQISLISNFNNTNTSSFNLPGGPGGGLRGGPPDNATANTLFTVVNNGDGGFIQDGQVSNDGISRTNSLGLNFRDDIGKKLSFYGSYTFTDKKTVTISNSQQTNLFETGNVINFSNSNKVENSTSHRMFMNAEWRIDTFNQIKFSPSFSYKKTSSETLSDFLFNNSNNAKLNEGNSSEILNSTQPSISGTILYNHRFRKAGRILSLNLNGGNSITDQDEESINNSTFFNPSGGSTINHQNQYITEYNSNPYASARLSYIEPLAKKKSLEFNYTYGYSFAENDRETFLNSTSSKKRIDSLSNIFENTFTYQRYGINYRFNDKKYNYSIGLAAQSNQLNGESFINKATFNNNSFNWFPLARFTYNFSRSRSFTVSYNSAITAPSSTQLQPVYDYSNVQFPVVGNPNLKPEFKNTFNARYNNFDFASGNILFTNISFSFTNNKVVTNAVNKSAQGGPGSSGAIQETQYLNADGTYNINGFYNFSKPFENRKYTLSLYGNINYAQNISFINTVKNNGKTLVGTQGLNFDVRLNTWLEIGAGGNFTYNQTKNSLTPQANTYVTTYTISSLGKIYLPGKFVIQYDLNKSYNNGFGVSANPFILNGYIERQFSANNQWSIRLQAYDLLKQNQSVSRTVNANAITDTRTNRLGQYFMLSFNFRLQKFKGQQQQVQHPGPPPENIIPPKF